MNKIPVTNNGTSAISVGTSIVLPGETRHFEEHEVPHHLRPKQEAAPVAAPVDPLAELLKGNVASVVAALNGMLFADIERLGELEQLGAARKGVLSAIAEIQLTQANLTDVQKAAAALSDEALAAALAEAGTDINTDPEYVAALEAEQAKRIA